MSEEDKKHELGLEHARTGYSHVQEVIRFVDTKAGALLGLVVLVTLVPVYAAQWLADDDARWKACVELSRVWLVSTWGVFALSVIGLLLGVVSLWFGIECVAPRGRGKAKASLLFPVTTNPKDLARLSRKLKRGLSTKDIVYEYEAQLTRSGNILAIKMRRLSWAAYCFKIQMAVYVSACIWALLVYTLSEQPAKTIIPTTGTTVPPAVVTGKI